MDTGYVDAEVLVTSQAQHEVTVCGPVPPDTTWQKRAGEGFDLACFIVDWAGEEGPLPRRQDQRAVAATPGSPRQSGYLGPLC